jgi:hypothetical protein
VVIVGDICSEEQSFVAQTDCQLSWSKTVHEMHGIGHQTDTNGALCPNRELTATTLGLTSVSH